MEMNENLPREEQIEVKREQPEVQEHIRFEVYSENQSEPARPAAPQVKEKKHKRCGVLGLVAVLVTVALFAAVIVGFTVRLTAQEKRTEQMLSQLKQQIAELEEELNSKSFTGNGNSISGSPNAGADGGMTPGQVYAKTQHSVVAITNEILVSSGGQIVSGVSSGTGFVLTEDGYIVTNYHVVEDAGTLTVTAWDGTDYTAQIRGYDAANDLAVLKIEAEGLQAVTIGSSDELIVGDQVAVIGNPLGELTSTLTVGYISAKDRVVSTDGSMINMLQTDAAVNSGNSGGPVFNMKGEVVGIITAKYSGTTSSGATIEGIGFAIPIDDVLSKITDLRDYGYITGAYLGVLVQDMDQDVAQYYGLPLGAYVKGVTEGYCAAEAGVQAKDIIVGLGDHVISNMNDLTRALQNFKAGDTTTITVWRGGIQLELEITLDEKPQT